MTDEKVDRVAKLVYEAIRQHQNGVMPDLPPWDEVKDDDDDSAVESARETARLTIDALPGEALQRAEVLKPMLIVVDSPEYHEMKRLEDERRIQTEAHTRQFAEARAAWESAARGWLPMERCPFAALEWRDGLDGAILVSDGTSRALAIVNHRTPWEIPPVSRPDLPAWFFEWELVDEFGAMRDLGGEEYGKEEIAFVPTRWTFLPEPPASA